MTSIKSAFNSMSRIQQAGAIVGVVGTAWQIADMVAMARRTTRIVNRLNADSALLDTLQRSIDKRK